MSEIVTVLHPAIVRHVPKGLRKERVEAVAMRTPVRLREADASAFEPVATLRTVLERFPYHAFEGRLWLELTGSVPGSPPRPFGRGDLLRFLAGETRMREAAGNDMSRHFVRTPLVAATPDGARRGGTPDLSTSRRVLDDTRDEAPGLVRRLVEDGVVLAGERVFVLARGPLATYRGGRGGGFRSLSAEPFPASWRSYGHEPGPEPHPVEEAQGYPVRIDGIHAFHSAIGSGPGSYGGPRPDDDQRSLDAIGIPRHLLGDDDVALMANVLPALAIGRVSARARSILDGDASNALLRDAETLRRYETRGMMGAYGRDDAEDVLRDVARVVASAEAVGNGPRCPRLAAMSSWIEGVALARLRRVDAPVAGEDAEALSTMLPGA